MGRTGRFALSWRPLARAAALALLLAAAAWQPWTAGRASTAPASRVAGRAAPSLGPQLALSAALGASDRSYFVSARGQEALARNRAQRLAIRFTPAATTIRAGSLSLSLSLRAAGDAGGQRAFASAPPRAYGNRVAYARAGLQEWYVNGPLGLEQGFTVARPISAGDTLTLRLAAATNGRAQLDGGGQAVKFTLGAKVLRYGWASASDARGRMLPVKLSLTPGAVLLAVDTHGAAYPLRIDPLTHQGRKLTGVPEEQGSGALGASVALSADGNTALVGAPHDSDFAGAAWVFTRTGSTWSQQGPKLTGVSQGSPPGEEQCEEEVGEEGGCGFGASVALSPDGNTALIGSPRQVAPCPTRSEPARECRNQGAVWIFTRAGSTWTRSPVPLTAGEEETPSGHFGRSVAISADGSTLVVGAPAARAHRGSAWVFNSSPGGWQEQHPALSAPEEGGEGYFGAAVALSADGARTLVGVPGDNGYAGSAWVFSRAGLTWTAQAKLTGEGEIGEAHFGRSVALSGAGDVALVGGFGDNGKLGAAWPFQFTGSAWTGGEKLTGTGETAPAMFGYSVALAADGHSALIGAPGDASRAGAAWFFTGSGTSWSLDGAKLTGTEAHGNPGFGWSVALASDGETAVAGGPQETEPCPTQGEPTRECHGAGAVWPFARGEEAAEEQTEATNSLGPRVNGVTPNEGPASGGTAVTISGSHLALATAVDFGSSSAAFTVNSNNSITAISPPHQPGTVDVTVTRPGMTSPTNLHDRFSYVAGAPLAGDGGSAGTPASAQGGVLVFGPRGAGCTLTLISRKLAVHRGWRAALKLLVRGSGSCRASARLTVRSRTAHQRARSRTIASATFALPAGRTVQVVLILNSTGRQLLRARHGRLSASLALARLSASSSARASLASVSLTLAPSRPKHR